MWWSLFPVVIPLAPESSAATPPEAFSCDGDADPGSWCIVKPSFFLKRELSMLPSGVFFAPFELSTLSFFLICSVFEATFDRTAPPSSLMLLLLLSSSLRLRLLSFRLLDAVLLLVAQEDVTFSSALALCCS